EALRPTTARKVMAYQGGPSPAAQRFKCAYRGCLAGTEFDKPGPGPWFEAGVQRLGFENSNRECGWDGLCPSHSNGVSLTCHAEAVRRETAKASAARDRVVRAASPASRNGGGGSGAGGAAESAVQSQPPGAGLTTFRAVRR
ncbi:unnamed protein product, partial [Scytosiphon promiscuus]